jgi:hypothetical protein
MDGENAANIHLLWADVERVVVGEGVDLNGEVIHSSVFVYEYLVLLGQLPVVLIPDPYVDGEVLEIQLVLG